MKDGPGFVAKVGHVRPQRLVTALSTPAQPILTATLGTPHCNSRRTGVGRRLPGRGPTARRAGPAMEAGNYPARPFSPLMSHVSSSQHVSDNGDVEWSWRLRLCCLDCDLPFFYMDI